MTTAAAAISTPPETRTACACCRNRAARPRLPYAIANSGTAAPASNEEEGSFYELAYLRHDQRQSEREQQNRPDLDLVHRADADQAPQPCAGEQEGGERRDEAGGNRVRPPGSRSCATGEHDRQHREDAGCERGDDARRERDRDEDEHPCLVVLRRQAFQRMPAWP